MNVHTPERQPNETQQQHRERRAKSRALFAATQAKGGGSQTSRQQQRADRKRAGNFRAGTYGLGLLTPQRQRNQKRMAEMHRRNEHGAFTFTGQSVQSCIEWDADGQPITGWRLEHAAQGVLRRVWLAGISAQRGY